jgi:hypothetical protein
MQYFNRLGYSLTLQYYQYHNDFFNIIPRLPDGQIEFHTLFPGKIPYEKTQKEEFAKKAGRSSAL